MKLTSLEYEVIKETPKTISVRVLSANYTDRSRNPLTGYRGGRLTDYDLVQGVATTHYESGSAMSYSMMTKFLKEDRKSVYWSIGQRLGIGVIESNEFGGCSLTRLSKQLYIKWGN